MKIMIVSDNHGDRDILAKLVNEYTNKVDLMIHCGDSEMLVDDPIFEHMPSVLGNNDWGQPFLDKRIIEDGSERILLTHGHLYNVNFTMDKLATLARNHNATMIAFGHTHQLAATMKDNKLFINPGSISLPRGEFSYIGGTYAIVELQDAIIKVQFYNRALEPIDELKFTFERNMK